MADNLPDYIDTTWAKKRIASNLKKIASIQARLSRLKGSALDSANQQVADLQAENTLLQQKIDALGNVSGKDLVTSGQYSTVPTSNTFSSTNLPQTPASAAGGKTSDVVPQPKQGLSPLVLGAIAAAILGAVLIARKLLKRHGK
jgi:hypothetical protein